MQFPGATKDATKICAKNWIDSVSGSGGCFLWFCLKEKRSLQNKLLKKGELIEALKNSGYIWKQSELIKT